MTIPYPARATLGLAALALGAGMIAGCTTQEVQGSPETVSTAGAAQAAADVQSRACPSTAPTALSSNVDGLDTQLEPLTATKVLLCVYPAAGPSDAVSGSADTAAASPKPPTSIVLTNSGQINGLQRALNSLAPPPTTPVSCPMDSGTSVLGIFTAGTQETEVLVQTSGCPLAGNGAKTGWVGESDVLGLLSSVVASPSPS